MIKQHISTIFRDYFSKNNISEDVSIFFETPKNKDYGDIATNVCFSLAKQLKQNPKMIAENICNILNDDQSLQTQFEFIPINGFINVRFSDSFIWMKAKQLFKSKQVFQKKDKKILIEYVSANPTGPLHIGHGRWAVLGSAIASLLSYIGYHVDQEFYINDAGNQIQNFYKSVDASRNGRPIPEDGYHGAYIQELAKQDVDPIAAVLSIQKEVLTDIGVTFNCWFSEKTLHETNKIEAAISYLKQKNLVYEKEKAVWFKSESFGDEKDRVLIKSDGRYTYFAVDVAYHYDKLNRGYNELIDIWGADHHGYVKRMSAAVDAVNPRDDFKKDNFKIMIGQLVNLTRAGEPVRMSKRTGEMITLKEVVDEIGADAVRYFLIQNSPDTHIEFDLDLAKKKSNENPVFYIQYAHARICSILTRIKDEKGIDVNALTDLSKDIQLEPKERALLMHTIFLYDEIFAAAQNRIPHRLTQYLYLLAKGFHLFYEACPVLKAPHGDLMKRIFILTHTQRVLAFCLKLLGISQPERM